MVAPVAIEHNIESKISALIQDQFPDFYHDEGPVFILFVKAYYEWLEETGNPLYYSRKLISLTDVDATLDDFLIHFQQKYLYGIPFDVIVNKRFLLKHVLDVYRSKSSIAGYKLLFRLIYNEDLEVYLPGRDVLRASDGTWKQPRYVEINPSSNAAMLVNKTIVGVTSNVRAVVESYVIEAFDVDQIGILNISNIVPKEGDFIVGEKLVPLTNFDSGTVNQVIVDAPIVKGSLDYVEIVNGGKDFAIGDVLKIAHRDLTTNAKISYGTDGLVRVSNTQIGRNTIQFTIVSGGFGYTSNTHVFIVNDPTDTTGTGANFSVQSIGDVETISYNTDIIADYESITLDSSFPFPKATANVNSVIEDALTTTNDSFGSILSLTGITTGQNYTAPVTCTVRSTLITENAMSGTVSYNSASKTITGTGTSFTTYLANDDVMMLRANSSITDGTADEHVLIKQVVNTTSIELYNYPTINSTASAGYYVTPTILPSNFALYDSTIAQANSSIPGENEQILGIPTLGNNVISSTRLLSSGISYVADEFVKMYLYGGITTPTIVAGGNGYTNGDLLIISGGIKNANGTVTTDGNGTITSVSMSYLGSGYEEVPTITVRSTTGSGATLTTSITEYNPVYETTGIVKKRGIGRKKGYWTTTRGFLNSDKYLHDSYYYQDFSYELQSKVALEKYKSILKDTFHISGTEMFGLYLYKDSVHSNVEIDSETTTYDPMNVTDITGYKADTTVLTADIDFISIDMDLFYGGIFAGKADGDIWTADTTKLSADVSNIFDFN